MGRRLERMRAAPAGDWTLADAAALCREHGLTFSPPGGGSHYKVSHGSRTEILTIPYRRPLKPVYVRRLVAFVDAVEASRDP